MGNLLHALAADGRGACCKSEVTERGREGGKAGKTERTYKLYREGREPDDRNVLFPRANLDG